MDNPSALAIKEGGFTIQELLVVILVGSVLIGFSMTAFLFAGKLYSAWQDRTETRETTRRALQTIAIDLRRAKEIRILSDSAFTITPTGGKTGLPILYKSTGGRIYRGDVVLGSEDDEKSSAFLIRYISPMGRYTVEISTVSRIGAGISHDEIRTVSVAKSGREMFLMTKQE